MSIYAELRRRHVVKVAIVYATVGFAVLQGAALLLPTMNVPDWTFRVIAAVVILGFPLALVLAWALEITPAGVQRTPPIEVDEGGKASAEAPAVPARSASERSIAVLPFANLSGSEDNEYFSDGITEELLTALSKVRGLEVISRTSIMRFKGSSLGTRAIADELVVAHVVEGSVRRHADRVRITAQLIDARTDHHLWADTYDRDLDDIFAIQSDVAERIAKALQVAITPAERTRLESRPTDSVEAYQDYLQGRHALAQRTTASIRRAIEAFDRAVEADPAFALAWAHRGQGSALLAGYGGADPEESLAETRRAARRALEIQPDLAEAHAGLGLAAQNVWDWEESERELRLALEIDPAYTTALQWYAHSLLFRGRHEEAIKILKRAFELDPLAIPLHMALGVAYFFGGQAEEAIRVNRRALELEPGYLPLHRNQSEILETLGRLEAALEEMETISRLDPGSAPASLVRALRVGLEERGEEGYWEAKLDLARAEKGGLTNGDVLMALAQLGRLDEAMDLAEAMVADHVVGTDQILMNPGFVALRAHPRFDGLLGRLGRK